jgi:hypothetical protein
MKKDRDAPPIPYVYGRMQPAKAGNAANKRKWTFLILSARHKDPFPVSIKGKSFLQEM